MNFHTETQNKIYELFISKLTVCIEMKYWYRNLAGSTQVCILSYLSDSTHQLSPQEAALFSSKDIAMPVSSSLWSLVWWSSCTMVQEKRSANSQLQEISFTMVSTGESDFCYLSYLFDMCRDHYKVAIRETQHYVAITKPTRKTKRKYFITFVRQVLSGSTVFWFRFY